VRGPGKYDAEVRVAAASTSAQLTLLIILEGNRGTGFSVAALDPRLVKLVPGLLRNVALEIEHDLETE